MTDVTLRVDWTQCKGRGVCADLVPELITMDEWGYPIVSAAPVAPHLLGHAKRAVRSCPMLALHVHEVASARVSGGRPPTTADRGGPRSNAVTPRRASRRYRAASD